MNFASVDTVTGKFQLWTGTDSDVPGGTESTGTAADGKTVKWALNMEYTATDSNGDKSVGTEEIAKGIMDAFAATDNKVNLKFKTGTNADTGAAEYADVEYEVSLAEDGKTLKFNMTDKGFKTAADYAKDMQNKAAAAGVTDADKAKYLDMADELFRGNFHVGVHDGTAFTNQGVSATTVINPGTADSELQPAIATFDYVARAAEANNKLDIKDGAGLKIGDTYYVWAGKEETLKGEYGDNVKTVDIRDLVDEDGNLKPDLASDWSAGDNHDILTKALDRLTVAAKDNDMFHVQVNNQGDILIFTEKSTNSSDADLTTYKGLQEQLQSFDGIKANVTTTEAKGADLKLQIGDTSDDFNRLAVSVKDMHTNTMGIGDVDISTAAGAAEAVSKIKNAINYVSSTRGDLGAIQNRLEHTINNLSVAKENITAAESRIRDVDMAEEMMAYTKNNILVQAAQAMLAQANQVPQGVLQLLQ